MLEVLKDPTSRPMEKIKDLLQFIGSHPEATVPGIAQMTGVPIKEIVNLVPGRKLHGNARDLAWRGRITFGAYYMLGKIPAAQQETWIEKAKEMPLHSFIAEVLKHIRQQPVEIKETRFIVLNDKGEPTEIYGGATSIGQATNHGSMEKAKEYAEKFEGWVAKEVKVIYTYG